VKLLFDENLSFKLVTALSTEFPGSTHVRDVGLTQVDDEAVWKFARDHGYAITSKDDDFHQRSFLYGAPPKVIWLRVGNCPTARIIECLHKHAAAIKAFGQDAKEAFLVLR
jgi:predicted nuclease of predicted toxin-antitoxin system